MSDEHEIHVSPDNLYMVIGEIRSDVKKLLFDSRNTETRLSKVEKRQWWFSGVTACLAFFAAHLGFPMHLS